MAILWAGFVLWIGAASPVEGIDTMTESLQKKWDVQESLPAVKSDAASLENKRNDASSNTSTRTADWTSKPSDKLPENPATPTREKPQDTPKDSPKDSPKDAPKDSPKNDTSPIPTDKPDTVPAEICNDRDDNGNGQIDEGVRTLLYRDLDRDGYGNGMSVTLACWTEAGYVTNGDDCDDTNSKKTIDCSGAWAVPTPSPNTSPTPASTPTQNTAPTPTTPVSNQATPVSNQPTPSQTYTQTSTESPVDDIPGTDTAVISQTDDAQVYQNTPSVFSPTFNRPRSAAPSSQSNTRTNDVLVPVYTPKDPVYTPKDTVVTATIPAEQVAGRGSLRSKMSIQTQPQEIPVQKTASSWWWTMCWNGVCELVTIDGKATLEPSCPQDCELSCARPWVTDVPDRSANECLSLIQQDSLYVILEDPKGIQRLRSFEEAWIITALTQPFAFADDQTLRIDLNTQIASLPQMIDLLYRIFGTGVRIEPVPVFFAQTVSSVVAQKIAASQKSKLDQRYLEAMQIPETLPVCVEPDQEVLIWVVDNAFDTRHPVFAGRVKDAYDLADMDRSVLPAKLGADREHGTIAAGLAAGQKNERSELQGADLGTAKLILIKATKNTSENGNNITSGIEWISKAAELGARIIVTSRWSPLNVAALKRVVTWLSAKGVLIVAAAGNYSTNKPFYPAAYPEALAVGAVDKFMTRATFSNYGYRVDVVAPGVSITAPIPWNRYKVVEGTSESAPLVAGVLAAATSLDIWLEQIITPREDLDGRPLADLGKWLVQFPQDLCISTQSVDDNDMWIFSTQSVDTAAMRDSTREPSVIDVLLRTSAWPSNYHASAPEQATWRSTLVIGRVSGACTILLIGIGIWAVYTRKKEQNEHVSE